MKALAGFIVSGRYRAILVVFLSGVLAFLLPPFSTLLSYVGAAAVALVTLRIGSFQGLQVLVISVALVVAFYSLMGGQAAGVAVTIVLLWLPCWLLSRVLLQTGRLASAIRVGAAFGVCSLIAVYWIYGDPAVWWFEQLTQLEAELKASGLSLQATPLDQVMQMLARLMTGILLASLLLGMIGSLLLGRWWQALLIHPGGLGKEFCQLRFGQMTGLLTLGVMLAGQFVEGSTGAFAAQAAMIMLVPYLFAGLAVAHALVAQAGRGRGWLIALYVLLGFAPQASLLLAGGGLLDTWVDFRRRLNRSGPER